MPKTKMIHYQWTDKSYCVRCMSRTRNFLSIFGNSICCSLCGGVKS